ncbi:MAG: SUMF1/EgtB/PvdO family nonheme iron enzyme, partial [Planctomycetales bacterium]|nr:SUMF1/EgtB/PvdO family nonheme iron enzyme [Planctomycetales bacterium]
GPIRFAAPYAVGRFEVTRAQFARSGVVAGKGCFSMRGTKWEQRDDADWQDPKFPDGFKQASNHPVVCVDWNAAQSFLKWLDTRQSGGPANAYRLPSEAEWEYSARGGTKGTWFWGSSANDACTYANVADRSFDKHYPGATTFDCSDDHVFTAPVGGGQVGEGYRFKANAFGLYDMLGNVWEWTQDCYEESYDRAILEGQ